MDGRVFIKKSTKKYDIIMLDAYNCDSIPFHMTTIEFLREVKSHLNEGGLVVANLWSSDWELYLSMVKTYSQVFPHLYRFNVAGENNVVLIAGETELSPYAIVQKATLMKDKYLFTYDYARIATHLDSNKFDLSHFKILTDDYAPVDWLQNKGK
jgi:spermidine synthase